MIHVKLRPEFALGESQRGLGLTRSPEGYVESQPFGVVLVHWVIHWLDFEVQVAVTMTGGVVKETGHLHTHFQAKKG